MEIITIYLVFAMLATIWLDVSSYTIPNWLVGSLLVLYPIAVMISNNSVNWQLALLAMAVVFFAGYVVFAMRWIGGGDVKLIAALSLWSGWKGLLDFIFLFAILGGIFSLILLVARRVEPYLPWRKRFKTPRILQKNAPIPYGVAIAGAFLWLIFTAKIPVIS